MGRPGERMVELKADVQAPKNMLEIASTRRLALWAEAEVIQAQFLAQN
jgi:hypothetical protein